MGQESVRQPDISVLAQHSLVARAFGYKYGFSEQNGITIYVLTRALDHMFGSKFWAMDFSGGKFCARARARAST
jgi:hypothetical protein